MANYYVSFDGEITRNRANTKNKKKSKYHVDANGNITVVEAEEKESKLDFFQKGAFEDGYEYGDVTRNVVGTTADATIGIVKGATSLVEGITDLGMYGVAGVADLVGADSFAEKTKKKAQENSVEGFFKGADDFFDQYSVLGRTSDAIMQGVGQVGAIILTGGAGASAGLSSLGATALTTGVMGVSSAGAGMGEAYRGGATDEEAVKYGIAKGAIDAGSELIFGGLGKTVNAIGLSRGISSLDNVFAQKLSSKISNQVAKNVVEYGVKASAEGLEEVIAGAGTAVAKKMTYMDDEELTKIIEDENLLEQFVVGTVASGMMQAGYIPGTSQGSLKEANATGRDFISGYTQNEQSVIDRVVEQRVEAMEKENDTKLSKKEIGAIEKEVQTAFERGEIDIDTIESVVGGDLYSQYDNLLKESQEYEQLYKTKDIELSQEQRDRRDELKEKNKKNPYETELSSLRERLSQEVDTKTQNDTFIRESYNEKARRSKAFEADLNKYSEKEREIVQKAIDSKILNNTRKTHEFVDLLAKLSADKGVSFDFTTNEALKESGFAIEGKIVNGLVDGNNIKLNINSNKALNTVVGHEITHVLEGTEFYKELQNVIEEYATTKGEYESRYKAIEKLYEGRFEGTEEEIQAKLKKELTADLVGDYLFTDSNFVNNLSTTKPNVFKRIYDEIKYFLKVATAGSKEAQQLEKVKRVFDKAYKGNSENFNEEATYKLSIPEGHTTLYEYEKILDNYHVPKEFKPAIIKDTDIVESEEFAVARQEIFKKATNARMEGESLLFKDFVFSANHIFYYENYSETGFIVSKIINIESDYNSTIDEVLNESIIGSDGKSVSSGNEEVGNVKGNNNSSSSHDGFGETSTRNVGVSENGTTNGQPSALSENGRNTGLNEQAPVKDIAKASSQDGAFSNAKKSDIQYSLSEDGKAVDSKGNEVVLETSEAGTHNSLMAIHNLSAEKLNGILELGGFPVPSIAIIDESNVGNLEYGNISVLLDKNSIDPANRKNEVYGSDVYSKRFPQTVQEVNDKELSKLQEYVGKSLDLEDTTLERAKSKYSYDQNFVDKFLQENNIHVDDVYKEVGYNYTIGTYEKSRNFVIKNDITFDKLLNNEELRNEFYDLYRESSPSFTGFTEKKIARFEQAFSEGGKTDFGSSVKNRLDKDFNSIKNGAEKVVDDIATNKAKRDTVLNEYGEQYDRFLNDLLVPVFGDKYLRNNKDLYTPSGNKRTFKQLYEPYTLDNIMKNMLGKVQDEEGFFYGAGNIRSNVSQRFKSIADIKDNADKLISSEEFKHVKEQINDKLNSLTSEANEYGGYSFDSYAEALNDISNLKSINAVNAKKVFKEYGFDMSDSMIQKSIDFLDDLKNAPTEYFEAKPQRVIGFDEVQAVVIPNDTSIDFKKKLSDAGFYVVEYDSNIEGDRANKIKQFDNLKFSLSNQNDIAPTGKYNVYGKDIALETVSKTESVAPVVQENTEVAQETVQETDEYAPMTEAEANERDAMQSDRLYSLNESDMPEEVEAPYSEPVEAVSPFEDKDIQEVGDRKQKAYMYENPEVKPYFQEEAQVMLGELRNSVKGERVVNADLVYESGGEFGVWGTKRETSEQIAYMLDRFKYSYADIEKGLNAIIEDHGAENNAISKRLEFMIDERLREGYTDFISGMEIPSNQDYINLLRDKQINNYSDEAYNQYLESLASEYAEPTQMVEDIAPTQAYEAIEPRPAVESEEEYANNKMKRATTPLDAPKERKFIGSAIESEVVDGKVQREDLDQRLTIYNPISNKKTLGNANAMLDTYGYEKAVTYFESQLMNKRTTLDDIALGERLIQEAIKKGDYTTAGELIQNVAILGTELGQKVQALSIIQRLTPEGQLKMLQKTVNRGKTKGDKAFEGVELTQEMIDKILSVYGKDGKYDQKKLDEAVEDVKQKLADQMKVTTMDKVNAWRYLSMLGNPKTHIRNLVSNVAMRGTLKVKNALARTIEDIAPIKNKTKTWSKATDAVNKFADQTTIEMKDVISDDSKYSDDASLKAKRQIFKNKILNGVYEFNSNMLAKEDWWFSKPAFKDAFGEYLTANGIKTEEDIANNKEIVEKAKSYAVEQSQIATFRQYSWLANKIREIENKNTATDIAVGAIIPFKRTPINIAKAGLSYSPLGFTKTLTYDMAQVKNGNMEASEMVDHLAQNTTGTALALIGYMLASAGLLNGGGDDDKEGKYDYQLGEQAYSVTIGDSTYSLSWLSPVAMPLFVGANAFEQLVEGKEWNGDVVMETLAQTLDPLSEMSFLSSLDSVLSSYDSGMQKFAGIGETMIQNYATQFVPTLSSQIATVMDDTKRSTKVAGDSGNKIVDETINKLIYKIPGLRETLEPSTDIWGNDIKQSENMVERAFETFIAPYAKKGNIATGIDEEIKDLYAQTGDNGIIPSVPYNYVNYNGEKYKMSAEEYTDFKKTYGQTANELLEELFRTTTYNHATSTDKAEMVNKVYDYARDEAKREYLEKEGVIYTNATSEGEDYYKPSGIKGAIENDITLEEFDFATKYAEKYDYLRSIDVSYEEYSQSKESKEAYNWAFENPEKYYVAKAVSDDLVTYRKYASELYEIKGDKDENGKTINGSRKEKVISYINGLDADYGAKLILFKKEYTSDNDYNNDIIEYLNSRNDISFEEEVAILKELGFTVDSDGTIYW